MNMTLGLDLGISATKVALMKGDKVHDVALWEGELQTSRLEDYIKSVTSARAKVRKIMLTGVGSRCILGQLCGIRTERVDEFKANGMAGRLVCEQEKCIVASMGTGTSFVLVDGSKSVHLGGSALGGGTLFKIFQLLLPGGCWAHLRTLSEKGDLLRIDTTLGDVCRLDLPGLPVSSTVVNFGKANQSSTPEDIAVGLVNMVVQNIGVMAYLTGGGYGVKTFVMIGRMTTLPQVNKILERLSKLYNINFIVPEHAEYMTAIGAALL